VGLVRTVNMSGRALVEFDAYDNIGWYDIEVDYLKVVDRKKEKKNKGYDQKATFIPKLTKFRQNFLTVYMKILKMSLNIF